MNGQDDDDDWLAALRGRPRPRADAATSAEATLLRQAQRRWPATPPEPASLQEADAEDLLARARQAGVLAPRRRWCRGCAERWQRWTGTPWRLGAAGLVLASLLAALVAVPLLREPAAPEAVLRAGPDGVVLLRDADPRARRDRIAASLAAAGVEVRRYERLGRLGLDADLPQPLGAAVAAALRRQGLAAPADGSLRVEVEAAAP